MKSPVYIFDVWEQIERRVRRTSRLALFTDFDGTLAGIQKNPNSIRLPEKSRRLLAGLAEAGATVGVISGRRVEDIARRVGLEGIWYSGAHGFFLRDPDGRTIAFATPVEQARVAAATRLLAAKLRGARRIRLERKVATLTIHYRGASPSVTESAARAVFEVAARCRLHVQAGKRSWELLPNVTVNKWTSIRRILKLSALRASRPYTMIYLGDDTTDENVFEHMTGISIAVGRRQKTAAKFYVHSRREAEQFLERLLKTIA